MCDVRGWRSVDGSPRGSSAGVEGRRGNIKKWGSNSGRGFSAGVEGR